MSDGFRRAAPAVRDWRERAECARFFRASPVWTDRMWTYEDAAGDGSPDPAARVMARHVCESCPVRLECLADAAVNGVQHGVFGGLRTNERRMVAHGAELDGVRVYSRTGMNRRERFDAYLDWLVEHPEAIEEARRRDRAGKQRRRERRREHRSVPNNTVAFDEATGLETLF